MENPALLDGFSEASFPALSNYHFPPIKSTTMNCPKCNIPLSMSDRQGVEIDFCPQCRGVWLDRGELDKIIERSSAGFSAGSSVPPAVQASPPPMPAPPMPGPPRRYDDDDDDDYYRRGKKKKSFLGDLFDF